MADLLIRNVDPKVIENLKEMAAENERTLEGEIRMLLKPYAYMMTGKEFLKRTEEFQRQFKGRVFSDSAELIREDRDR